MESESSEGCISKANRRLQRQYAIECLYSWEAQQDIAIEKLFECFCAEKEINPDSFAFTYNSLNGVINYKERIDDIIKGNAKNWSFARISKIDLAILRLAIYELLFCKNTPAPVVINEAIEISKLYSSSDAKRFVNGVLDKIAKERVL